MKIDELYSEILNKFSEYELQCEFTLLGNCIVCEYRLNDDCEEIVIDDNEDSYSFDLESNEELLLNANNAIIEYVNELLDSYDEFNNWSFSEPEIIDDMITFKIF